MFTALSHKRHSSAFLCLTTAGDDTRAAQVMQPACAHPHRGCAMPMCVRMAHMLWGPLVLSSTLQMRQCSAITSLR